MTSDFLEGTQVDQAASDFTKQAYEVKYLISDQGWLVGQKYHMTSYVNALQ